MRGNPKPVGWRLAVAGLAMICVSAGCSKPPQLAATAEAWQQVVRDGGPTHAKGPPERLARAVDTLAEAREKNGNTALDELARPWKESPEMLASLQIDIVDWFRHRGSLPGRTSPTRQARYFRELGLLMLSTGGFQPNDAHVESALYLANRLADAGEGLADVEAGAAIWDRAAELAGSHDGTAWPELKVLAARTDALFIGLVRDIITRSRRLTGEAASEFRAVTQPLVATLRPKGSEPDAMIDTLARYIEQTPAAAEAFPVDIERLRRTSAQLERYRAYVNARL